MARRKLRVPKNRSKFTKTLKKFFKPGGKLSTKKKREKLPAKYFLLPGQRKYPYINPNTGKPSARLLTAAYRRARQYKNYKVAAKAARLLKKYFGITVGK